MRDVLTNLYLWYHQLPDVDPTDFESPEAYLDAVRYRPLDTTFSYITSREANDAFFSDSQFIGLGFSTAVVDRRLRVLQVFPESPAAEAGLARADRIVEINGHSVDEIASGRDRGAARRSAARRDHGKLLRTACPCLTTIHRDRDVTMAAPRLASGRQRALSCLAG